MYVIGGVDIKEDTWGDVWEFDLKEFIRSLGRKEDQSEEEFRKSCSWKKLQTIGAIPLRISHHSAVVFKEKIIVYGGMVDCSNSSENLFIFEPASLQWTQQRAMKVNI